jgi:hypothetical protein
VFNLGQCLPGFVQIGLRGSPLRLELRRRHPADGLPGLDLAAFLDGDVGEPAGIFRRDDDLRGLNAAIRLVDPVGHRSAEHAVEQAADLRPYLRCLCSRSEECSARQTNQGRRQWHAGGCKGRHEQNAKQVANAHYKCPF